MQSDRRQEAALAYWHSLRRGGGLPAYRQFDPVDVPDILPHLMVLDVLGPPLDFRYRLIGGEVRARQRRKLVRRRVSELPAEAPGQALFEARRRVVESGEPDFAATEVLGPDSLPRLQSCLHLPFASDGARVDVLIAVVAFSHIAPFRPRELSDAEAGSR